ncbi:hypothetical protein MAL1_00176 [Bacteriophage DSS3_MAL1]|nr:hypothetical protein MAL1_00176 [Bacteriophage DSS3_MAL1]
MTHRTAIIEKASADMTAQALREVVKRLRARGQDRAAARLQPVIDAMEGADTIHISDQAGRA